VSESTSERGDNRAAGDAPSTAAPPERFGYVLVFVLATIIAVALLPQTGSGQVAMVLLPGATLLVTMSVTRVHASIFIGVVVTILLVAAVTIALAVTGNHLPAVRLATVVLTLGFAAAVPVLIVRRLTRHWRVDMQTVFGGLAIYLQIGTFFAVLYSQISAVTGQAFFTATRPIEVSDYIYYSFVTLTTVGYGDLTAAMPMGRILSAIEALFGQIYLVTVVALIVSRFGMERSDRQG
jgi:hypothetical protein